MAISTPNLVPLDFETIKTGLKTYLSNQPTFKSVDFESSNINVLLDILAYNTFHKSFYMNMVASEMFLDTAQMDSSVASHAKILNYLPRSFRSARAVVDITIRPSDPSSIQSILIPKGASFTGRAGNRVFTFTSDKNVVVVNEQDTFVARGVSLYEGRYISEVFVFKEKGRYVLSNPNIDTTSLTVAVTEGGRAAQEYAKRDSFIGVAGTDPVYFVQPADNGQYELVFGDNTFGKRPVYGSSVVVQYRISSGELPNGADTFDSDGALGGATDISVVAVDPATGGAIAETIDEIRFHAPRAYSTQQRAVTTSDYSTLILQQFPDVQDVGVFGGEELYPPMFGHVAISMVSTEFSAITEARRRDVVAFVQSKCPATVTPIAIDPAFTYIRLITNVSYDVNKTTKTAGDLQLAVLSAIKTYTNTAVNGFNKTAYYSKLLAAIDSADISIISNDTTMYMYRLLNPTAEQPLEVTLDFGNALYDGPVVVNPHAAADIPTISSTFFTYDGKRCRFEDDGVGSISVVTSVANQTAIVKPNVGTVDYETGRVVISALTITGYEGDGIRVYAQPRTKDISAVRNSVLVARDSDISIVVTQGRG